MVEPVTFTSSSTHFNLPLLFAGQAQKEFVLNQSIQTIDAMLQGAVEASLSAPPATIEEGNCYRVSDAATGDWLGHDGEIAIGVGNNWHYVEPPEGSLTFDKDENQFLLYKDGWQSAVEPPLPQGGNTIDTEARDSIEALVEALRNIGIFADPA